LLRQPLKPYAAEEINRCAKNPNLRTGLKLHFGNQLKINESVTISPTHAEFRIMPSRFGDRQQGGHFTILYSA